MRDNDVSGAGAEAADRAGRRLHASGLAMTRLVGIWRSWTLLRQLVVGVSAVVMVVLLTIGTLSVLSLRSSVLGIIDAQLSGSADGFTHAVSKYRITPNASGERPAPDAMKPLT